MVILKIFYSFLKQEYLVKKQKQSGKSLFSLVPAAILIENFIVQCKMWGNPFKIASWFRCGKHYIIMGSIFTCLYLQIENIVSHCRVTNHHLYTSISWRAVAFPHLLDDWIFFSGLAGSNILEGSYFIFEWFWGFSFFVQKSHRFV